MVSTNNAVSPSPGPLRGHGVGGSVLSPPGVVSGVPRPLRGLGAAATLNRSVAWSRPPPGPCGAAGSGATWSPPATLSRRAAWSLPPALSRTPACSRRPSPRPPAGPRGEGRVTPGLCDFLSSPRVFSPRSADHQHPWSRCVAPSRCAAWSRPPACSRCVPLRAARRRRVLSRERAIPSPLDVWHGAASPVLAFLAFRRAWRGTGAPPALPASLHCRYRPLRQELTFSGLLQ